MGRPGSGYWWENYWLGSLRNFREALQLVLESCGVEQGTVLPGDDVVRQCLIARLNPQDDGQVPGELEIPDDRKSRIVLDFAARLFFASGTDHDQVLIRWQRERGYLVRRLSELRIFPDITDAWFDSRPRRRQITVIQWLLDLGRTRSPEDGSQELLRAFSKVCNRLELTAPSSRARLVYLAHHLPAGVSPRQWYRAIERMKLRLRAFADPDERVEMAYYLVRVGGLKAEQALVDCVEPLVRDGFWPAAAEDELLQGLAHLHSLLPRSNQGCFFRRMADILRGIGPSPRLVLQRLLELSERFDGDMPALLLEFLHPLALRRQVPDLRVLDGMIERAVASGRGLVAGLMEQRFLL